MIPADISNPAGSPSRMTAKAGPCDSPAVKKRKLIFSSIPLIYPLPSPYA